MRDDRERLRDIQEAIEDIERHAVKGRQAFDSDELIQTWIGRVARSCEARQCAAGPWRGSGGGE